jgi:hypothetical protein
VLHGPPPVELTQEIVMNARRLTSLAVAAALAGALAACTSPVHDEAAPRVLVGRASAGSYDVQLWTAGGLTRGLNSIYVKVIAGSTQVTDAEVTFDPLMTMTSMSHRCPVLGAPTLDADGLYRTDVVFQMKSMPPDDVWSATVTVKRPADVAASTATFPSLVVADAPRTKSFTDGVTKLLVSFNLLASPRVGQVPVAVTVHQTTDMGMHYDPVISATIHLVHSMPSMGHGGSGTVDPTHASSVGRYDGGMVGYTMDGDWVTSVSVTADGHAPFTVGFPTSF